MEIIVRWKMPKFISLTKKCNEFVMRNVKMEIPDDLVDKAIAIIDELFERANEFRKIGGKDKVQENDKGNKFTDVIFPIFPNEFNQVERIHKGDVKEITKNTKWFDFWSAVPYKNIAIQRIKLLGILNEFKFIGADNIPDTEFSERIEDKPLLIDLNKDKLVSLRKRLIVHRGKLAENENKEGDSGIQFEFKKHGDSTETTIKINNFPELKFKKTPAAVIHFFYQSTKATNSYKSYKDFQVFYAKNESVPNIGSNEFRKRVESINRRVKNETDGLIKELIVVKTKNKNNEINEYRLAETPR